MRVVTVTVAEKITLHENDDELTGKFLQEAVGGYIEAVTLNVGGHLATMFVNEEGKLDRLPVNRLATILAQECGFFDIIVGDVVITGPADRFGNSTKLSDFWVHILVPELTGR